MESLHKKLEQYRDKDVYPFHMPGHKRQLDGAYKIDITEIDGFDNLNNPTGIIKDLNEEIARMYNSKKSYFTVNGSTCGNLSAISAVADAGDYIIISRNCHKSVYNAAFLRKLHVEYIMPEMYNDTLIGEVTIDSVREAVQRLEKSSIKPKAVVITSPTYEGVVSDIPAISMYLHSKKIALIVDSAHGAHFHFHEAFPEDYIELIDICIMSAHKTLPVLNQAAIVHVNSTLVDAENVKRYISMYQTSSPSYVIMDSMSRAIELLGENDLHKNYVKCLYDFYEDVSKLHALSVESISNNRDISKIVIYTNGYLKGEELCQILRSKYHLELEMCNREYALAMTSCMDTEDGLRRLSGALTEIDGELDISKKDKKTNMRFLRDHTKKLELYEVSNNYEELPYEKCEGRILAETIIAYPPGIPLIVSGEVIEKEDIDYIRENYNSIEGMRDGMIRTTL